MTETEEFRFFCYKKRCLKADNIISSRPCFYVAVATVDVIYSLVVDGLTVMAEVNG